MLNDFQQYDPVFDEETSEYLGKSTVQLFKRFDTGLKPFCSGVLFEFEGYHFIITASHVLKGNKRSELAVRIGNYLVSLEHDVLHFTSEMGEVVWDKVDVGAILIRAQGLIDDIKANNTILHLEDFDFNPVQFKSDDIRRTNPDYIMFGYPESKTKLKYGRTDYWNVKALYFKCGLSNQDTSEIRQSGFTNHLFCTRTKGGSDPYTNQKQNLPDLHGMSGCGLWRMIKFDIGSGKIYIKICGIFHGVERGFLIFTKIDHAINLIRESYNLKKLPNLGYNINWKKK